jgi:alpha-galactosidase
MKIKMLCAIMMMAATSAITLNAQELSGPTPTPPMGWNSWNKFANHVDESVIRNIAEAMVTTGLKDAGYTFVNIDDCWHSERDADGFIQCNPKTFPRGMKALGDYVHSKGLKFGIYTCAGTKTCAGFAGSCGHEFQDALQYARWGVDYIKEDWCNAKDLNPIGAYSTMRDAIKASGRSMVLSLCEWGSNKPWEWGKGIGQLWRTTGDIGPSFKSVMSIIEQNKKLRKYAGYAVKEGVWNDPDMLEVGNGMTTAEDRAHFSMWCMMAAPLILGNDICNMSEDTKAILLNKDVIAIDQDPLGVQGFEVTEQEGIQLWAKPLQNGDWAICVLNTTDRPVQNLINWHEMQIKDEEVTQRTLDLTKDKYTITNLWPETPKKAKIGNLRKTLRGTTIGAHDVAMYRLTLTKK